MADKGKGLWALRNAPPQNTYTGNRCEWVVSRENADMEYRLEMDAKGVFLINATRYSASDENRRIRGEVVPHDKILASYRDTDGNKLEANKQYGKITRDGQTFKVMEVIGDWEPRWRIREYTPLSKTRVLTEFTAPDGKRLQKGKDYPRLLKDGIEYEVHSIEREGGQERWEVSKSAAHNLNSTQRRISSEELKRDFMNHDGTPLDIDAIRRELAKGHGKGR